MKFISHCRGQTRKAQFNIYEVEHRKHARRPAQSGLHALQFELVRLGDAFGEVARDPD